MGTCDACGPSVHALVEVTLTEGTLELCGHCARTYSGPLSGLITRDMRTPETAYQPV